MNELIDAFQAFWDRLEAIDWLPLGVAVLVHVVRLAARSRAWRNVIAAAYPNERVPWPSVFAAYVAGVGVNAVVPARSGDLLKLFLVRRRIPGSAYSTLAATLAVEAIFALVVGSALILWALSTGRCRDSTRLDGCRRSTGSGSFAGRGSAPSWQPSRS